jgi:hypothetical protein
LRYSIPAQDIELARRYLIIRSAIKGMTHDKAKFSEGGFQLSSIYHTMLEDGLMKANEELTKLRKYVISVQTTDQPTIYQAKVGSHTGYFEINVVEILRGTQELLK